MHIGGLPLECYTIDMGHKIARRFGGDVRKLKFMYGPKRKEEHSPGFMLKLCGSTCKEGD